MGLDADVRCRCWEEGRVASPPPFAQHVRVDEEGWPGLDLPWQGNQDKHRALDDWRQTCCRHKNMRYADEHISNWGGYHLFQAKLAEFGWPHFPTLQRILPESNGGTVSPADSAAALEELDDFARRDFGKQIVLVDADTSEVLQEYVPQYEGVFSWGPGGWQGGVDPEGFFVRRQYGGLMKWLGTRELFRSRRFTQDKVGSREFLFRDERTGATAASPMGVSKPGVLTVDPKDGGGDSPAYPKRLTVESRRLDAEAFEYILRPLRVVFRASVVTGNPVRWL